MSKVQSKRATALKTLALVILIGVGHFLQTYPAYADVMAETPALQTGQE
jgi:hypothetical protein